MPKYFVKEYTHLYNEKKEGRGMKGEGENFTQYYL